jgi:radical SAM superfamily enzyme YgiQ (UPF0313 family)
MGLQRGSSAIPPLGIAYLAATLKKYNFNFHVIDSVGEKIDSFRPLDSIKAQVHGLTNYEIIEKIPTHTNVIGISSMFANDWIYIRELVKLCRQNFPEAKIVLGGEYPTADYSYILENYPEVDICVLGEGEDTLLELLSRIEEKKCFSDISGIAFNKDGQVIKTPRRLRIKDLEQIPWPDWSQIPIDEYMRISGSFYAAEEKSMPLLGSRGCPYSCTFCSSPNMWTTRWVAREIDDVIAEIKHYVSYYGAKHIRFFDLTAIINRKWTIEFCERLIAENLPVTWSLPVGTRTEAVDEHLLRLLKRSGCLSMDMSAESGSPETLKRIKKRLSVGHIQGIIRSASKIGFKVRVNVIFGLPGQTKKEVLQSIIFILKSAIFGASDLACMQFAPYPGSELFDQLKKEKRLELKSNDEYELYLFQNINNSLNSFKSWSDHISDFQLGVIFYLATILFYFVGYLCRPWRLFKLIKRVLGDKPHTMMEYFICSRLRPVRSALTTMKIL